MKLKNNAHSPANQNPIHTLDSLKRKNIYTHLSNKQLVVAGGGCTCHVSLTGQNVFKQANTWNKSPMYRREQLICEQTQIPLSVT